jgi:hypothetical protein
MSVKRLQQMQHVQHSLIYFCNIYMKQLQHTSETFETLETYICNIEEGECMCRSIPAIGLEAGGEWRRMQREGGGRCARREGARGAHDRARVSGGGWGARQQQGECASM